MEQSDPNHLFNDLNINENNEKKVFEESVVSPKYGISKINDLYKPICFLGKGSFGNVYQCIQIQTQSIVSLKVYLLRSSKKH